MIELKPEPLTAEAFAPFGSIIDPDEAKSFLINENTTRRYHALAEADTSDSEGNTIISIFRGNRRDLPIEIKMVERHPLGSQAFLPAQPHQWLVVVASGDKPEAKDCKCFLAEGNQGVQYNKGTWHHPLLIIQEVHDFWVIDRRGEGDNLEEVFFEDGNAFIEVGV